MATPAKMTLAQQEPLQLDPTPFAAFTQLEQPAHPTKTPVVTTAASTETSAGLKLGSPAGVDRALASIFERWNIMVCVLKHHALPRA